MSDMEVRRNFGAVAVRVPKENRSKARKAVSRSTRTFLFWFLWDKNNVIRAEKRVSKIVSHLNAFNAISQWVQYLKFTLLCF